jgi:hypothetical protein
MDGKDEEKRVYGWKMGRWSWIGGEECDEGVGCVQRMKRRDWNDGKDGKTAGWMKKKCNEVVGRMGRSSWMVGKDVIKELELDVMKESDKWKEHHKEL